MANQRLVHITTNLGMGGAEHFLFHLVRHLQPSFDQTVISFRGGVFEERIRALGVPVYIIPFNYLIFYRLFKVLFAVKPDVIHALLWSSNTISRVVGSLLRVPVVCAIHSPVNSDGYDSRMRTIIDRLTMWLATRVVMVSAHVRDSSALTRWVPAQRMVFIENGIDAHYMCEQVSRLAIGRDRLAIPSHALVIGTVGRCVALKNQELVVRAIAALRHDTRAWYAVIVGDGPLRKELRILAVELGVNDRVIMVSGAAAAYYSLFDFFILPSHIEGLSMALLEAMSLGIPVLASAQANHGVIIDGFNGFIFDASNSDEVVQILRKMANNSHLCAACTQKAQEDSVQRFSFARTAQEYANLFLRVGRRCEYC